MKKIILSLLMFAAWLSVSAQTMNVVVGNVTYQIPAAKAGEMIYSDATTLTVLDKTFTISDIANIYIDGSTVTENAVSVLWQGTSAKATVPYNIMSLVDIEIDGADVEIEQGDAVVEEITYTLSGNSTAGSLYMDGSYKATFVLNGLSLTNPNGAAVNIRDGKRINIQLADGTTNTFVDGANGDQKACFAVKGHTEFSGAGVLNLTGNTKHAFWGKEYVEVKKTAGTINVLKAVGDGFNVNQYFKMNGGTININNVGDDGIQVSFKTDDYDNKIPLTEDADNTGELLIQGGTLSIATTAEASKRLKSEGLMNINESKAAVSITITNSGGVKQDTVDNTTEYTSSACIKCDSILTVGGGTLKLTNTGQGGRAINCEYDININGGNINAAAKGQNLAGSGGGGGWWAPGGGGGPGGGSSNLKNAKCIKAKRNLTVTGGTITASSDYHECIESKQLMNISGGVINATGSDDAINAGGNMTIEGGSIYAYAASNDALDSNGNMIIKGGVVIAFGGGGAESGIDIDESHNLQISGGYIFSVGGRVDARFGTCTQAYGYTSNTLSLQGNYAVVADESGNLLFAVEMPKTSYSGVVLCSAPTMVKNIKYKVGYVSAVGGTNENGFVAAPTASNVTYPTSYYGSGGTFTAK